MATYYSTVTLLTLANAVANMKWQQIILLKHLLILAYANNFLVLTYFAQTWINKYLSVYINLD